MNPNKIKITPRDEINLKLAFASIPFRSNALYPCMCMIMNSQPKTVFYKPQIIFLLILHRPQSGHRTLLLDDPRYSARDFRTISLSRVMLREIGHDFVSVTL